MIRALKLTLALVAILATSAPVMADMLSFQAICNDRTAIVQPLAEAAAQGPIGFGVAANGIIIELWQNPQTGVFSLLLSDENGETCLIATGQRWMAIAPGDAF